MHVHACAMSFSRFSAGLVALQLVLGPPTGNPDSPEPPMTMHAGPRINVNALWSVKCGNFGPVSRTDCDWLAKKMLMSLGSRPFSSLDFLPRGTKVTRSRLVLGLFSFLICFLAETPLCLGVRTL